jgi:hypothetical protein
MRKLFLILPFLMMTLNIVQAQQVALTQSYQNEQVSFAYPAGWVVGQVTSDIIEIGSSLRALDAPNSGLNRGEVYMRILVGVGALASADPQTYLEQLNSQATRNQVYNEIDAIRINGRQAALVTRDDLGRNVQRIIGIIDMGNGQIGGILATVAQDEIDLHYTNVLAILATLSATEVVDSGYWTYVDDFIRFRYPFEWTVNRVTDNVVNVTNTAEPFQGSSGQALVQVVTLDLFVVDVSYEQIILGIEAEEPTYQINELVPTTVGNDDGAVVRYTVEVENIEGLFILHPLFDGRIGLVNLQVPSGEIANYADVVTTIAESVEVPATVLFSGSQLDFDTFAHYETADGNYAMFHPPNWLVQEISTGFLFSNDLNIAERTINNLERGTVLMLVYPQLGQLPFSVSIRTPTAITNRFRQASPSIGITQLSETIRTIDEDGLVTSTVYGLHPEYDMWIIAQEKPNDQIVTSLIYTPRSEMGLHQRQIRIVTESFEYTGLVITDCDITAMNVVNARSGPGAAFSVQGSLLPNSPTKGIAQAVGVDGLIWWQIEGGSWVREDVVTETDNCSLLPPSRS